MQVPRELLHVANREPEIRYRVMLAHERDPILLDGEVVGFVTPHQGRFGFRLGPIYVAPEHRGKGLARAKVAEYLGRGLVHWIADTNEASRRMHESLGFRLWKKGRFGGWYRIPTENSDG